MASSLSFCDVEDVEDVEDAEDAGKVFEMLMGNEVAPRKSFIQSYAHHADIDA